MFWLIINQRAQYSKLIQTYARLRSLTHLALKTHGCTVRFLKLM